MKRKAISYLRISSDLQIKGTGVARQIERTQEYCKINGLELIEDLRDIGLSGYKGEHIKKGQFGQFLESLKKGELESDFVLVVESLDRISRQSAMNAFTQFSEILRSGVEIHTLIDGQKYTSESVDQNPTQMFISLGSMIRSHDESKTKSDRISATWKRKRERLNEGHRLTKIIPGWIQINSDDQFELKPQESETVKTIFKLSIEENMGSYSITKYLNENLDLYPKITPDWKSKNTVDIWGHSFVVKILNTPTVYGSIVTADGVEVENYYPKVISKEEFQLSRHRASHRKLNSKGRKGERLSNLFQGIITCGCCEGPVALKNRGERKTSVLICKHRQEARKNCSMLNWKYDEFEKSFLDFITEIPLEDIFEDTTRKKRLKELELRKASIKSDREEIHQRSVASP